MPGLRLRGDWNKTGRVINALTGGLGKTDAAVSEAVMLTELAKHSGPVLHVTETAIAPGVAGAATLGELQAWVDAQPVAPDNDTMLRYTATDNPASDNQALFKVEDGVVYFVSGGATTAKQWVHSTDGMNAANGDKIIWAVNHNINLAEVTDLSSIQLAPSTGDWADVAAGTGNLIPDAAWTVGANQTLPFGSDVLTVVSNLGTTNWLLFTGGEDVPSQDERFGTVALLPPPTSVNSGAMAVVFDDPTPANNRAYIAQGPAGGAAIGWI